MKQAAISTPCPAPANDLSSSRRLSFSSSYNNLPDDTAQIEYTRAFEPTLRNSKPRRSSLVHGQLAKRTAPVTVFEQVNEDEELVIDKTQGKSNLLSKPARKMGISGAAGGGGGGAEKLAGGLPETRQGRAGKMSLGGAEHLGAGKHEQNDQPGHGGGNNMAGGRDIFLSERYSGPAFRRAARRGTIYIPDDTTFQTIQPGNHATTGLDDTFNIPALAVQPVQNSNQEQSQVQVSHISRPVRRPRMSLSAAPRRMPLVPVHPPENIDGFDVCGDPTGKENIPPMADKVFKAQAWNTPEARFNRMSPENRRAAIARATQRATATQQTTATRQTTVSQQTAATLNRQVNPPRPAVPLTTSVARSMATSAHSCPRQTLDGLQARAPRTQAQRKSPVSGTTGVSQTAEKKTIRQHIDLMRLELQASKLSLYPVLSENVGQPELYEDSWLSQQEVALTEVVNEIFAAAARSGRNLVNTASLRESLIALYHQPEVAIIHKRLQASLVYGALSKPKAASTSLDPSRDIGLKKKFLGLFLETYDENALRAAAEVIVGRQIPKRASTGEAHDIAQSEEILDPRASRRALTDFLGSFFVAPIDIDVAETTRAGDGEDSATVRWRKTVLRSVMLIWLLDQAKASGLISGCLFKATSPKKSSTAMLNCFAGIMMPSIGDLIRALKQMDCEVTHVQDPLDEVVYRVENLAVDLRDGILLTHLVEVLLYNRKAMCAIPDEGNATVTIQLPDSTQLLSDMYLPDTSVNTRMLSQHIKMPCLGRVQKHFNVQVALSALEGYDVRGANVVGDVTADDILNGHREKTLSLLWSLVSAFGLKHLVDFEYVMKDAQRAMGTAPESSVDEPEKLLQEWAAAYAAKSGVKVSNFTTSFADGKAYAAIVDGFSNYIQDAINTDGALVSSTMQSTALEARLNTLGCSTAFTKQLTSSVGNIPTRETTISNLAFLASRLLPLARQYHAALTIQRAYRKKRAPTVMRQRIALMRMARDCATVVQTGERVHAASLTIQRAWRAVLDARIAKMSKDVTVFQSLARGWAGRRKDVSAGRIVGGW